MKTIKLTLLSSALLITLLFNAQQETTNLGIDYSESKNVISFNYLDLMSSRIAISYERLFLTGKLGLKIPLGVTYLTGENQTYIDKSILQGGLDINYYPLGQKKVTFFTGLSSKVGKGINWNNSYCPTCNYVTLQEGLYVDYLYYPNPSVFISGYVNNGLLFNLNTHFSISGQFGIGAKKYLKTKYYYYSNSQIQPSIIGELNASFRF